MSEINSFVPGVCFKRDARRIVREESKADFIKMWDKLAGEYGKYNTETGYFELNGLTDITYDEAQLIMTKIPSGNDVSGMFACPLEGFACRTHMPIQNLYALRAEGFAWNNPYIESINLASAPLEDFDWNDFATGASRLKYVLGVQMPFYDSGKGLSGSAFSNCTELRYVDIWDLGSDIAFSQSPLLELRTFEDIIAHGGGGYNIDVHPDVYAKLTDETNTEWHKVLKDALQNYITFTTQYC